jgi:GTP cyclohydrolase I
MKRDSDKVWTAANYLLSGIGESVDRGGLLETPERFSKAWAFWTKGYEEDPAEIMKVFEDGGEKYDQMVLVKNIPVYSHCEHHLASIFGVAHVGYIPDGKICGLSKLNRVVDCFARRLQVQERLTDQIAEAIHSTLDPIGVAVQLECRHMCMESRGVCQQGHSTVTTSLRGVFKSDGAAKQEFLDSIK